MASHGVSRTAPNAAKTNLAEIEAYKDLVKRVREKIADRDYTYDTLALTTALLRRNSEYYTIWNYRRLILQYALDEAPNSSDPTDGQPAPGLTPAQQDISLILKEDLEFLVPLIKETPKCYWIWNHRKWLLRKVDELLPVEHASKFWQGELALDSKMLGYDARNFHGWSYRREIAAALENCYDKQDIPHSVTEAEFAYTTKMVRANLSNFSAWHNRSRLLCPLLDRRKADGQARRAFLNEELEFITSALYTDPADQSLWFYHQCLTDLVAMPDSKLGNIVPDMDEAERVGIIDSQIELLKDMMEDADDCKWIYQSLINYHALRSRLSVDSGASKEELREWLKRLQELDPLRRARWNDLASTLVV